MKIAAIDIGSNSIKLAIAEVLRGGAIHVIRREKEGVRLGHRTLMEHHLSSTMINRAAAVIASYRQIAERTGAEKIVTVATASVREADNRDQFVAEITRKTGVNVEVLSGVEEARLIGIAASYDLNEPRKSLLNIDIGGGSTELSLLKSGKERELQSIKIGAVRLTDQFLQNDPPTPEEISALRNEIMGALERPLRELRGKKWDVVSGTSGTILSLAHALSNSGTTVRESASGWEPHARIARTRLSKLVSVLQKVSANERAAIPGINAQRAEIIVAGGIILESIMRLFHITEIRPSAWSLREGVILDRVWQERQDSRMRFEATDKRLVAIEALGERFGYEAEHGKQVAHLAGQIFDQLHSLHGLTPHHRTLLSAGALLHDLGYVISHESHHKHSQYLILNSDLTGFTEEERRIIANVARYHRKALPKTSHPEFSSLSYDNKVLVWKLGGIVRFADALDRSHQSRVKKLRCSLRGERVLVSLLGSRNCEHEIWAAGNKSSMFEEAFSKKIEVKA